MKNFTLASSLLLSMSLLSVACGPTAEFSAGSESKNSSQPAQEGTKSPDECQGLSCRTDKPGASGTPGEAGKDNTPTQGANPEESTSPQQGPEGVKKGSPVPGGILGGIKNSTLPGILNGTTPPAGANGGTASDPGKPGDQPESTDHCNSECTVPVCDPSKPVSDYEKDPCEMGEIYTNQNPGQNGTYPSQNNPGQN